ncbi:hypothetical protein Syun_030419 [Stephania yunnanensis]|uniref:Integrase catalytic domain-containing protein n=1 Tax=Stephania yunnanensis TaxID=152371 RepID=A0AAP0E9R8_9MAGN
MRSEAAVEGALATRTQFNQGRKGKKYEKNKKGNSVFDSPKTNMGTKSDFPPCKHCGRKCHPPFKRWRRPDQQCEKCQKRGHHQKICRSNPRQRNVTQGNLQHKNAAQVVDQEEEEEQLFVASCFASSNASDKWLVDSGCTNHMTFDRDLFKELDTSITSKVRIGNGDFIAVKGKGTIAIESVSGTKLIKDVLFVPNINQNLLSVGQLLERGFKVIFESNRCLIKDSRGEDGFKVNMKGKSFVLDPSEEEIAAYSTIKFTTELWHKRLGHFHHAAVLNLQRKELVQGLPHLEAELPDCKTCQFGKQTRLPFKQATWRATKRMQLIHTDLAGPQRTPSLNGSKYYIIFIDDHTRMCWIYFLKFKTEVAGIFWKFKQWIETQSGYQIQALRSDNGKEYTSNQFNTYCEEAGIEHQLIAPYTP